MRVEGLGFWEFLGSVGLLLGFEELQDFHGVLGAFGYFRAVRDFGGVLRFTRRCLSGFLGLFKVFFSAKP